MLVVMNSFTPLMYLLIYWILRCTLKKCISTGHNALRLIPWLRYVRDFMKFFGFNSEQKKNGKGLYHAHKTLIAQQTSVYYIETCR